MKLKPCLRTFYPFSQEMDRDHSTASEARLGQAETMVTMGSATLSLLQLYRRFIL